MKQALVNENKAYDKINLLTLSHFLLLWHFLEIPKKEKEEKGRHLFQEGYFTIFILIWGGRHNREWRGK